MFDDLDRPLGRDRPRRKPSRRPGGRAVLTAFSLALLAGASAATVLLQPSLRHVDVFADLAAVEQAEATRRAAAPPPLAPLPRGPKIIAEPLDAPTLPTITYPPDTPGQAGQLITVTEAGSLRQPPTMAASPDDALLEPSDVGPLPVRASDGRRPFDVYSAEPANNVGIRVAIVVGGLGISQTGTQAAIRALPAGVTLGFAAAGNSLDRWMAEARRAGHELVIQVPMEPFGYPQTSPGPHTVTADAAAAGQFDELFWSLGRTTNYVGVMNYMGARLSADPAAMRGFLGELARRGLMYLDDGSSTRSLARDTARDAGTPFAAAGIVLDADQRPEAVAQQLATLERIARADGTAIATASAFDSSTAAITAWIAEAETRGITVVPLSSLTRDPEAR